MVTVFPNATVTSDSLQSIKVWCYIEYSKYIYSNFKQHCEWYTHLMCLAAHFPKKKKKKQ